MIPQVKQVTRVQCKASILIEGLSGSGKSGAAMAMAHGLCPNWEEVLAIDTENNSLPLYKDLMLNTGDRVGEFMHANLYPEDGFKPSFYKAYQDWAVAHDIKVVIQDSISHMWMYQGGVLTMVNEAQVKDGKLNKYTAWGTPEVMAEKQLIMDLIRNARLHVISTIRVKEKMEIDKDDTGKTVMRSLGEQQIGMPDLKYEPDLVLTMVKPGRANRNPVVKVQKSRYPIFEVDEQYELSAELIEQLRVYLAEGADPEVLLEQQRQDYIAGIKQHLDEHENHRQVWTTLKSNQGYKDTPLNEIPLPVLKLLASQLMAP